MSKYTTEVRFICESVAGETSSQGFDDINDIIETAAPSIFNFDFPIFDEEYRLPLEIKILRHYYTREICEETVGLWKLRLQDRLCMIMPYYNKLYQSELLDFNPFYDVDLSRTHSRQNAGNETRTDNGTRGTMGTRTDTQTNNTATSTSETHSDSATQWDLYSDTPQGGIEGINADTDSVANNTYLTNARKITNAESGQSSGTGQVATTVSDNETTSVSETTNNTGTTAITSAEDYIEHVSGKQGSMSYSKMLEEFRKSFLNIDKMVIDDLSDLFFGLWG